MRIGRIEDAVAREMMLQQEGLEEPGGVRQMPLGRRHVGHGLHHHVLGQQRLRKFLAAAADDA